MWVLIFVVLTTGHDFNKPYTLEPVRDSPKYYFKYESSCTEALEGQAIREHIQIISKEIEKPVIGICTRLN